MATYYVALRRSSACCSTWSSYALRHIVCRLVADQCAPGRGRRSRMHASGSSRRHWARDVERFGRGADPRRSELGRASASRSRGVVEADGRYDPGPRIGAEGARGLVHASSCTHLRAEFDRRVENPEMCSSQRSHPAPRGALYVSTYGASALILGAARGARLASTASAGQDGDAGPRRHDRGAEPDFNGVLSRYARLQDGGTCKAPGATSRTYRSSRSLRETGREAAARDAHRGAAIVTVDASPASGRSRRRHRYLEAGEVKGYTGIKLVKVGEFSVTTETICRSSPSTGRPRTPRSAAGLRRS